MYSGYRKRSEENLDPPMPSSASKTQSNRNPRFRGLSSLSQVHTQPVRTKHLLDELREEYDDIDNSASKRPIQQLQDVDPLISWDKQSLPKGLEWMNPTPSKVKNLSSNTIPETLGSLHHRDISQPNTKFLSTEESQNLPSTGHSQVPNTPSAMPMVSNNILVEDIPSSRVQPVNEINKENLITPFKVNKMHSNFHVPVEMGLFTSSKKRLPSKMKPERNIDSLSHATAQETLEEEHLTTPLKKGCVDSTPASTDPRYIPPHRKASPPPVVSQHIPLAPTSLLSGSLHQQSDLKKSPTFLTIEPHASLLTPARPISQIPATAVTSNTPFEKPPTPALKTPSLQPSAHENSASSVEDLINTWRTPAKVNPSLNLNDKLKSGPSLSHLLFEDKKISTDENNLKSKENNYAAGILSLKPLPRKIGEAVLPVETQSSKMPSLLNSAQKAPSIPCPVPLETQIPLPISKGSNEMPPPSQEVPKHPLREIKEVQNNVVNHSLDFNSVGKRSTNDQICVNNKPYTVLSLLGKGGSSVVYLVLEPDTSKLLAVKCVNLSELDQSTYEGYLNEISLLSQLQDSDCVIRMFDHQHCKDEKILYVVMEKGETDLSKLIRDVSRTKKVSPAMTVYYWIEMLNAVSFIHKRGTIHSDLKPANFLLVAGRLKLIDFGIASSVQGDMTSIVKDSMTGTYNYISPEALCSTGCGPDGKSMRFKISYKSDVWSLGCILYNLVYGHTPFQTITNQFMKMTAIANPNHKIPYPPAPGFPKALLLAMQACLVRNPKLRPSVDELLQYQYLGSVNVNPSDMYQGLVDRVRAVVHSADSSENKLSCIQTLLSSQNKCSGV